MRWESNAKIAELTRAQTWSKRDEGNFGGRSLLTSNQNEIAHYGIPGMKWGVQTKEYVKTGYNTLKRRQAILKQKRKAEAKAKFEEGYHRGQRVAANTWFIRNRTSNILKRKQLKEEGSFSDRAVSKAFDYALKKTKLDKEAKKYGLDAYLPMAKDFLKDRKDDLISNLYEYLQSEAGRMKLQKTAAFLGKGISKSIGAGMTTARLARKGGQVASKAAKSGIRVAAKSSAQAIKSGYKWLRTGNPTGAQKIQERVRSAEKMISKYGNQAANALSIGSQKTHQGAKYAQKQLALLLAKRRRRS